MTCNSCLLTLRRYAGVAAIVLLGLLGTGFGFVPDGQLVNAADKPLAAPPEPVWPAPELVTSVRDTLVQFYSQRAAAGDPYYLRAPEWEIDKAAAAKDPDTLWELNGGPGAACHPAVDHAAFVNCTGKRLARSLGWAYFGGLPLFDGSKGYYGNEALVSLAGYYALYHAFAHDFDATTDAAYTPGDNPAIRDNRRYHRSMLGAYEHHMRDALIRMLRDTRGDPAFQADVTRSVGVLLTGYVRTIQATEERGAWQSDQDRRDALALTAGLVQRAWWEWMAAQPEGPRTAGFAALGSQDRYSAAVALDPGWQGTDYFVIDGQQIPSLRPAYFAAGPFAGLWFDADFAMPGDWYCHSRFAPDSSEFDACIAHARQGGLGGTKSPFGHYYGATSCADRTAPGSVSPFSCGQTNLGSIAEEWMWTHVGARLGASLLAGLPALPPQDPNAAPRKIGARTLQRITERLGYGVAGWHGGAGEHDDMEWALHPDGVTRAIRTLAAGRHDDEAQDGLYSLGERDVTSTSGALKGDTWPENRQELPGAMENHVPGPNSLYGTLLFAYVLADKSAQGLSGSLFDTSFRNNTDEFGAWVWLSLAGFHRCPAGAASDPAAGSCFAYDETRFPYPADISRETLTTPPDDASVPPAFRYLYRDPAAALSPDSVADPSETCRGEPGVPWRPLMDAETETASAYLLDEGGFGAYNEQIQAYGGFMRLAAHRYPLDAPDLAEQAEFEVYREEVLKPWYDAAHDRVRGILELYRSGYGYVPDIENSSCLGTDPQPGNPDPAVHAWQYGTWDSVGAATVRRALWYSVAALWYWQYDDGWNDVDPAAW